MDTKKPKTPHKKAGSRLRELSIKRRESVKPSDELFEILRHPKKADGRDNLAGDFSVNNLV